jgi:thiol-disulfide isomerase/thioredoxin
MKKIAAIQLTLVILIAGVGGSMLIYTNVYNDIHDTIVSTLCLSCIKLDPVSRLDFVFETANGENHPEFVLENLTKGPLFIEYRSDVCAACDIMAPIIKEIFHLSFEKEDTLYKLVNYNGTDVNFYHINLDHASKIQKDSFPIYDKDHRQGVPMFVIITVKYDRGIIKPCYTAAYGTLGLDKDEERRDMITDMIEDGIKLYGQNQEGYKYP